MWVFFWLTSWHPPDKAEISQLLHMAMSVSQATHISSQFLHLSSFTASAEKVFGEDLGPCLLQLLVAVVEGVAASVHLLTVTGSVHGNYSSFFRLATLCMPSSGHCEGLGQRKADSILT
jgi:hypothetical protein